MRVRNILFGVLTSVIILILLLPTLISTQLIKEQLLIPAVNRSINAKVQAETVSFSWFGPQVLQGVKVQDKNKNIVLRADRIAIENSLFTLLQKKYRKIVAKITSVNGEVFSHNTIINLLEFNGSIAYGNYQLAGKTSEGIGNSGAITAEGIFTENDGYISLQTIKAQIVNFPTALFDSIPLNKLPANHTIWSDAIGPRLDASLEKKDTQLDLRIKSAYLQAHASGDIAGQQITIHDTGNFVWHVQPKVIAFVNSTFFPSPIFIDDQKITVNAAVAQLTIPLKRYLKNELAFDFKVNFSNVALIGDTNLTKLQGYIQKNSGEDIVQIHDLFASVEHQNTEGTLQTVGKINLATKESELIITGNNLPTAALDPIGCRQIPLSHLLGAPLQFQLDISNRQSRAEAIIKIRSDILRLDRAAFLVTDKLELLEPIEGTYLFTQPHINYFNKSSQIQLAANAPLAFRIEKLSAPKSICDWSPEKVILTGDVQSNAVEVVAPYQIKIDLLNLQLIGKNFSDAQLFLNLQASHQPLPFLAETTSTFSVSLKPNFKPNWILSHLNAGIRGASGQSNFVLDGKIDCLRSCLLTLNGQMNGILKPDAWLAIFNENQGVPILQSDAFVQVNIEKLALPLSNNGWQVLTTKGLFTVKNLAFKSQSGVLLGNIQNFEMPWNIDGLQQTVALALRGATTHGQLENNGAIAGTITLSDWLQNNRLDFSRLKLDSTITMSKFPIAMLEAIVEREGICDMVGKTANFEFKSTIDAARMPRGLLTFKIDGHDFKGQGSLAVDQMIQLADEKQPLSFNWTITPARYAAIKKAFPESSFIGSLVIGDKLTVNAALKEFKLPWFNAQKPYFGALEASGKLEVSIPKVILGRPGLSNPYGLENFSMLITSPRLSTGLNVQLSCRALNAANSKQTLAAQVLNPFTLEQQPSKTIIDISLENFPSATLLALTSLESDTREQLTALMGPQVNGLAKMQLENGTGPIQAELYGANGKISFEGYLQDDVIRLTQPFIGRFGLTSLLRQKVLYEISPLLGEVYSSDNLIYFEILPDETRIPLDFSLDRLVLPKIKLDLGRLYFQDQGMLSYILNILHSSDPHGDLTIWFTPLYASLNNGILLIERMDMLLAGTYPNAVWGKIDFNKDKVNLIIGLGADTLKKAFGAKELPKDYILQLPMKGSLSSVSIDKSKATSKITALVAQSQGGAKGAIVGGLLDLMNGGGQDKRPPPPTTTPLPWEDPVSSNNQDEIKSKQSAIYTPADLLQKGTKSLLNILR